MNGLNISIISKTQLNTILQFNINYIYSADDCKPFPAFKPYMLTKNIKIYVVGKYFEKDFLLDRFNYYYVDDHKNHDDNSFALLSSDRISFLSKVIDDGLHIRLEVEFKEPKDVYIYFNPSVLEKFPKEWIDCDIAINEDGGTKINDIIKLPYLLI